MRTDLFSLLTIRQVSHILGHPGGMRSHGISSGVDQWLLFCAGLVFITQELGLLHKPVAGDNNNNDRFYNANSYKVQSALLYTKNKEGWSYVLFIY